MSWERLSDTQWAKIKKVIPPKKRPWRKKSRRGRKPVDDRKCYEGILWILWTGAQWSTLPRIYGAKSTVHDRLKLWAENGVLEKLWRAFLGILEEEDRLKWDETFVDGTFSSAKKGANSSAKLNAGKERS
jgi:putative transposase